MEIATKRLLLRPPDLDDVGQIFSRFASDAEVTRYVGWPRHVTVEDTRAFVDFSRSTWQRWPAGPLLIFERRSRAQLGSTGLDFETPQRASTGYVLARDVWGHGYASEALAAIVELAGELQIARLYALCHVDHIASARVLQGCGFLEEGVLRRYQVFPNLASSTPADVRCFSI